MPSPTISPRSVHQLALDSGEYICTCQGEPSILLVARAPSAQRAALEAAQYWDQQLKLEETGGLPPARTVTVRDWCEIRSAYRIAAAVNYTIEKLDHPPREV